MCEGVRLGLTVGSGGVPVASDRFSHYLNGADHRLSRGPSRCCTGDIRPFLATVHGGAGPFPIRRSMLIVPEMTDVPRMAKFYALRRRAAERLLKGSNA